MRCWWDRVPKYRHPWLDATNQTHLCLACLKVKYSNQMCLHESALSKKLVRVMTVWTFSNSSKTRLSNWCKAGCNRWISLSVKVVKPFQRVRQDQSQESTTHPKNLLTKISKMAHLSQDTTYLQIIKPSLLWRMILKVCSNTVKIWHREW